MNNNMTIDSFRSKDLAESAFLYASGAKLIKSDNENGKVWFIFADKSCCEKLTATYWSKQAVVNAKEFSDAIRTLKDIIFNK